MKLWNMKFEGTPKICVPLMGKTLTEVLSEIETLAEKPIDFFEWRVDAFTENPITYIEKIKTAVGAKPLLCTVRTVNEGGHSTLNSEDYEKLLSNLIESRFCNIIDIELSCGQECVERLVETARNNNVGIIISKHDFLNTPSRSEIAETLVKMKNLGADLPKFAVMPSDKKDVAELLLATFKASERVGAVITMSMGEVGRVSRMVGGFFGSAVTFAAGVSASAPGQINSEKLSKIIGKIDR